MIVCEGDLILPEHLPPVVRRPGPQATNGTQPPMATLDAMERDAIATALRLAQGNRSQAARLLGISERNLYRKIREAESLSGT